MELVFPEGSPVEAVENDIGRIWEEEGGWKISFKQLLAESGKVWDQVHSGNLNRFVLPAKLPPFTFFRIPATEEMGVITKC